MRRGGSDLEKEAVMALDPPRCLTALLVLAFPSGARLLALDCASGAFDRATDDFYYTASSAQGAVGDVVAVEVGITVETLHPSPAGLEIVGCHDEEKAGLLFPAL